MKNKFLINKLFFLIFFFFKISTVDSFSANEVSIVVKVNNEIITNLDIQNEYRYLIALNNKLASIDKDEIMVLAKNSIVREKIKKKELEKYYDLNQENEHIDEIIQNFYVKLGINNETDFKNYLSSYDLTLDQIKKKLKIEAIWNQLIFKKYQYQVEINENKIREELKNQLEDQKTYQNNYMLYEILYRGASKEKNEEKFKIIKDSILKNGFENTANIYSESETSKLGGKIGWINENQLSKELRKKISNLEIGEFTNPINVPGGLLIIKLFEKEKKETVLNFEGELKKIISYEKNKQFNQFSIIYFNKIKARTTIYES